jgi:thiol-disulfide isomerase/thioredoxin
MSNNVLVIGGIIVGLVLIVGGSVWYQSQPGKLDSFAQCLGDQGATFFGAFWCPHCQNQKALFGKSEKFLPYVECSTPDGQGQLQVCIDEDITGYPTWEFADGERLNGEVELSVLAERTGCELP